MKEELTEMYERVAKLMFSLNVFWDCMSLMFGVVRLRLSMVKFSPEYIRSLL